MSKSAHSRDYRVFRDLLRSVREEAGLTQKEVADALGMHQSYVSKFETGERRLDVIELRRVCEAMRTSLTNFSRRLETRMNR